MQAVPFAVVNENKMQCNSFNYLCKRRKEKQVGTMAVYNFNSTISIVQTTYLNFRILILKFKNMIWVSPGFPLKENPTLLEKLPCPPHAIAPTLLPKKWFCNFHAVFCHFSGNVHPLIEPMRETSATRGVLKNFAKFTGEHLCQGLSA